MVKNHKKEESLNLARFSANTVQDAASAAAIQVMELAKQSGKTPKEALSELNISVPELVSSDWNLIDFKSLVKITPLTVEDRNGKEIPILYLIEGGKDD